MEAMRPMVLSIAGFDPSGGAGILADIKTFEQHKVYGLGISTAQTLQTEDAFFGLRWEMESDILKALDTLLSRYDIKAVKIGIIESADVLEKVVSFLNDQNEELKIVWDPVIRSSSGFDFWKGNQDASLLQHILSKIYLLTPNILEALRLEVDANDAMDAARRLSDHCPVLLKGGHSETERGVDYLFERGNVERLQGSNENIKAKHGSGCVLSAAITANLALGKDLHTACRNAKAYIETVLSSNQSLLAYHHV